MRQEVSTEGRVFKQVPLIDVSALFSSDAGQVARVVEQVRQAAIEVGFFYVKGHKVSPQLLDAVQLASKYFFSFSDVRKRSVLVNQAHRGYVPFAQTTQPGRSIADLKESFNFAFPFAEDDPLVLAGKTLIGLNQWPEGEPAWRQTSIAFNQHLMTGSHVFFDCFRRGRNPSLMIAGLARDSNAHRLLRRELLLAWEFTRFESVFS